jgi:hypothetical protein
MKSSVFWDITPCNPVKAHICFLLHARFLLGLFFSHEDGTSCSSETPVDFKQTTRRYIPEYKSSLTSYIRVHRYALQCVERVLCQHGVARMQITENGYGLQIWRVAVGMTTKQSRTVNMGWSSSFRYSVGLTTLLSILIIQ